MNLQVASYFRDQFRVARANALQDAEGFQDILFALERFGVYLKGNIKDLGKYKEPIQNEAKKSPLAEDIPASYPSWHSSFSGIYELVKDARNDALHQGALARHLTNNAILLAIVLEDALMDGFTKVGDYMVREPVCASLWQPLSFVRQQMLANSFSYLPILSDGSPPMWCLISDYGIARYLRNGDRKERLAKTVKDAKSDDNELINPALVRFVDTTISEVLMISEGKPVLVVDEGKPAQLLGIVTPFDLL